MMNILERYRQFNSAKEFNNPDIKGVITISDYSFDIRLVNNQLYADSLPLQDFFNEAMLTVEEELLYEEAIYDWLSLFIKAEVA